MSSADRSVRSAVIANVALLVALAAFPLFAPVRFLDGFGISNASFAVFGLVRIFAVFAIVLAAIVWTARRWLESPAGRASVGVLTAAYGVAAALLFMQQWTVWYGRSGLGLALGCSVLALTYGRSLVVSRTSPVHTG